MLRNASALAMLASLGLSSVAIAAPVLTETFSSNQSDQAVSSTDLINGLSPSNTNYSATHEGGPIENLTNGTTQTISNGVPDGGASDGSNSTNAVFDLEITPNWHAIYTLPTAGAPNGYDITSVVSTTGHQDNRSAQTFDVLVSSNNVNFTSLSSGAKFSSTKASTGGSDQITITEGQTGVLATGVKYIEFLDQSNGATVYREFDVNGVPSAAVPEPTSLALIGLAGAALLARRQRD